MISDFISQVNWLDIVVLCVVARTLYVGIKNGILSEIFQIIGLMMSVFVTFHFYVRLGSFLNERIFVPEKLSGIVAYGIILVSVLLVFKLICDGLMILFKAEAHPEFSKWGGFLLGVFRGLMMSSFIFVSLLVSQNPALVKSVERSLTGISLTKWAPSFYIHCYDGFVVKFFPTEEANEEVLKIARISPAENSSKKK